jgi:N utilization substance protein B
MVPAMTITQPKPQGSKKARAASARLAAVQAVYQILANDQSAESVISEYKLQKRLGAPLDGVEMVTPDGVLFQDVVKGVYDRMNALEDMIAAALQKAGKGKPSEPLLMAILLCGAFEILNHLDIDAPLILSDYLNVTHAFYEQGESKLVNAVLDSIKTAVR